MNRVWPKDQFPWRIESWRGKHLMLETVHATESSRDIELQAIKALGRTAKVYDRRTGLEVKL